MRIKHYQQVEKQIYGQVPEEEPPQYPTIKVDEEEQYPVFETDEQEDPVQSQGRNFIST